MRRFAVALLAVSALGLTCWSDSRLETLDGPGGRNELLYLPNGKLLRVMSLGHPSLMADVVYLWAIQYYSDYELDDRQRYVEHVFDRVITELDPRYLDAYWLGALILILEAQDLEAGLRLLDKGAEKNPDEWILLYVAGWECYHAGQPTRAQEYFRRAMRVEDAPEVLPRLVAGMEARAGNLRRAIEAWFEVRDDPKSNPATRAIADRQIRELTFEAAARDLERAIERFRSDNGRWPRDLEELVSADYIRSLPQDPAGRPYVYDRATGRVWSPAGRVLGDS